MPELFWYYFIFSEGTWTELNFYSATQHWAKCQEAAILFLRPNLITTPCSSPGILLEIKSASWWGFLYSWSHHHSQAWKRGLSTQPPQLMPPLWLHTSPQHQSIPFVGAKKYPPLIHPWFIPDWYSLARLSSTTVYQKENEIKILNLGSMPETRRGIVTWMGQDLRKEYWLLPVFWNKTNPQNIWFWKVKIDSYMALVSSLGESWCCSTQKDSKKCSRDVTMLTNES